MTKFHEGQLLTACELAGPAPRVRSMTVHDIPVHAWLDMLCVSALDGAPIEMSCQLYPAKAACHIPTLHVCISCICSSNWFQAATYKAQQSMMSGSL